MTTLAVRARSAGSTLAVAGLVAFACVGSVGMMLAADGNPVAVAAPVLVIALLFTVWRLPVRVSALGLLFLMLVADYKLDLPYSGLWQSPFEFLGRLLFLNLSAVTGIDALRFPLIDLAIIGLLALRAWRRSNHLRIDGPPTEPAHALNRLLLAQLIAVGVLDLWGTATGGDFNESLWQLRHLIIFPLAAFLFIGSVQGTPNELKFIARLLIAAAVVKSLCGIYFIYMVVEPNGFDVEFTTSHADSLLFVAVLAGYAAYFLERPTRKTIVDGLLWVPIVVLGMVLNDRRLAYVSLGASLVAIFAMQGNTRIKRQLFRSALLLAPVAVLYLAVGWNKEGGVWKGAQMMHTLVEGDKTESGRDYRDIENADVIFTWSEHGILPLGFGHKFHEPVKLPDISKMLPTYQFHPHNTILWMWTIGGPIGFTLLFAPWVVALLLAARAFRRLKQPIDRAAALTCISLVIAHLNQVYGDMGTRSYFGSVLGALAVAMAGRLAVRSGAWP